jgi:hypothetical protein
MLLTDEERKAGKIENESGEEGIGKKMGGRGLSNILQQTAVGISVWELACLF